MIICAYTDRRWRVLSDAVGSLMRQDRRPDEIVLVVDHNPALLARAQAEFPAARVLANEEERGLSGARNTGVRRSRGEILAFLDDDATAEPGWLAALLAAFEEPAVMGAGGHARAVWDGAQPRWLPPEFLWVVGASYEGLPRTRAPVRNPIGVNMAFRREAFDLAGDFTSGIGRIGTRPMGCEETEFSIRLQAAATDAVVLYVPEARVDHHIARERASWRYFVSRCWAEGASKAQVTARVGATGALASERAYVRRTLPRGVAAGVAAAVRGDPAGVARAAAIVTGLGVTAAGFARGRLGARGRGRSSGPAAAQFTPIAVRTVELAEPIRAIAAAGRYGGAFVLARLHGHPLGTVTVPLAEGRADEGSVAQRLWSAVGHDIVARAAAAGRGLDAAGPPLLLRGLDGVVPPPPPAHVEEAPHVTVIVPTAGRGDALGCCLASLRALRYPRFDVLVVDNAPADGSTRAVVTAHAKDDPRIRYSAEPRPGSSVARNHGLARTTAEFVAFTDDDVRVDERWLEALVEPLRRDARVEAVTGLVLPAELETRAQWCFEQYRSFARGFEPRLFARDTAGVGPLYPYWGGVFGSGNSMAFRRSALRAIGGFDPALGAGSVARAGSDVEAFSHIVLNGGLLAYEPRAICWHTHRRDEAQLRRQLLDYGAGLTAILTKWCLRDPAVMRAVVRAVRLALARAPAARAGRRPGIAPHLRRREIRGYLLGPVLYARSVRWARRLRLDAVLTEDAG